MRHEITGEGWVGKIKGLKNAEGETMDSKNYFTWLVIDGQLAMAAYGYE